MKTISYQPNWNKNLKQPRFLLSFTREGFGIYALQTEIFLEKLFSSQ